MSPLAVLEVLERDLEQGAGEPCISPGTTPRHPLQPASPPCSGVLTCQGQLWGLALSPPTTRADRLGWKVGAPQLEAGGPRRGSAQVRGPPPPGIPSREGTGGKSTDFGGGADTGSGFTAWLWGTCLALWASASLSVKWEEWRQPGEFILRTQTRRCIRRVSCLTHRRKYKSRGGCVPTGLAASFTLWWSLFRPQRNGDVRALNPGVQPVLAVPLCAAVKNKCSA